MTLGPVMIDVASTQLDSDDREVLRHPAVGGVILFTRNYDSPSQLTALCRAIRALRTPPLLIGVDHEGGRVQRFHTGFTRIPSMGRYGELYASEPDYALALARESGWLVSRELLRFGIDLSFTPVLDLDIDRSAVIGARAFSDDPDTVSALARAWIGGMDEAGMASVAKHFPGHGAVTEDSHHVLPQSGASLCDFLTHHLMPYQQLVAAGLAGVMTGHLSVPAVDASPATFSRIWLQQILRDRLGFQGAIISDDLSMSGAATWGDAGTRAQAALDAGCDLLLVCNDRAASEQVLQTLQWQVDADGNRRRTSLYGRPKAVSSISAVAPRLDNARRSVATLLESSAAG